MYDTWQLSAYENVNFKCSFRIIEYNLMVSDRCFPIQTVAIVYGVWNMSQKLIDRGLNNVRNQEKSKYLQSFWWCVLSTWEYLSENILINFTDLIATARFLKDAVCEYLYNRYLVLGKNYCMFICANRVKVPERT